MAYTGRPISQQLGEWPEVKPGVVKVTKLDGDEALFSVGRRRGTKHTVLSRTEALAAWIGLSETFGFTAKDLRKARTAA